MYADIKQVFTKEQLLAMRVSQLKKLFGWYNIEYPRGKSKQEVVEAIFSEPEYKPIQEIPMSVRIRRINYGN